MLDGIKQFIDKRNQPLTEAEEMLLDEGIYSQYEDVVLGEAAAEAGVEEDDLIEQMADEISDEAISQIATEEDDSEIAKLADMIPDTELTATDTKITDAESNQAAQTIPDPTMEELAESTGSYDPFDDELDAMMGGI